MTTIADATLGEPRTGFYGRRDYGGNAARSYISTKLSECASAFEVWDTALGVKITIFTWHLASHMYKRGNRRLRLAGPTIAQDRK